MAPSLTSDRNLKFNATICCIFIFRKNGIYENWVLIGYLYAHFEGDVKPKGGPLEIEFFLLRGINEMGWRGLGIPRFFYQQKTKIKNCAYR